MVRRGKVVFFFCYGFPGSTVQSDLTTPRVLQKQPINFFHAVTNLPTGARIFPPKRDSFVTGVRSAYCEDHVPQAGGDRSPWTTPHSRLVSAASLFTL